MPASFSTDAPIVINGSPPHQRTKSDDSDRTVSSAGDKDDLTPSPELASRPRHARMPSQPTVRTPLRSSRLTPQPYPRGPGAFAALSVKTDGDKAGPFGWLKLVVRHARGQSVDGTPSTATADDDEADDAPPTPKVMLPRERKCASPMRCPHSTK